MAKANGFWTLIRRSIVKTVQPLPDVGEGWCLDCSLNDGHTLVISATAIRSHAARHHDAGPDKNYMHISMRQASLKE